MYHQVSRWVPFWKCVWISFKCLYQLTDSPYFVTVGNGVNKAENFPWLHKICKDQQKSWKRGKKVSPRIRTCAMMHVHADLNYSRDQTPEHNKMILFLIYNRYLSRDVARTYDCYKNDHRCVNVEGILDH